MGAGRVARRLGQLPVVVAHVFGHVELQLRQLLSGFGQYGGVNLLGHVQDDVVVGRVEVVPVALPVGAAGVQFHAAYP